MPLSDTERGALREAALLLFTRLSTLGPDLGAQPHPTLKDPTLGCAIWEADGTVKGLASGLDMSEPVSAHTALARAMPFSATRAALESLVGLIHAHAPMLPGQRLYFEARASSWTWMLGQGATSSSLAPFQQTAIEDLVEMVDRMSWCAPGPQLYHTSTTSGPHQEVRAASALDAALYWLATCRRKAPMGAEALARSGATTRAVFPHEHLYTEARRRGLSA